MEPLSLYSVSCSLPAHLASASVCSLLTFVLSCAKQVEAKEDGAEKKAKKPENESTWVEPTTVIVKPEGQLQLSEKELDHGEKA